MTITLPAVPDLNTPPLKNGDVLTRTEFERRYTAMPGLKKAELIEGVVSMPSPVSGIGHGDSHLRLGWLFQQYVWHTPGTLATDNATIRLDADNEPQPDLSLIVLPKFGGRVTIVDGFIEGSPDLVVEVAASSASIDLNKKLSVYRKNRVREYVVHRVCDQAIDWFVHRVGQFEKMEPDARGILKSEAFPGLWLQPVALVNSEFSVLNETLNEGLDSAERAAFVARLREAGLKA